ncbi:MAG: hypothetical protein IKZ97_00910, partial [Butyrivibrio sp.]|nr:hypothetical protein [Butyrivibrio sp.]
MGFFSDLFGNKRDEEWEKQAEFENWNDIVYTRKELDMDDPVQRREYVGSCLQQMEEASRELEALEYEYNDVTSHLRDMEEIDALPPEQRAEINDCARKIMDSLQEEDKFDRRKNRMTDEEFEHMERIQNEADTGADKLLEAEAFQKKIRSDLKRLDSEHEAYLYREEEIENTIENSKKLIVVTAVVLVVALVMLMVLQIALKLDVTYGYMIAILLSAIGVTVLYMRSTGAIVERKSVRKSISRLIMLQNQVKIRYVNNTNLIDYLCLKYRVMNSGELRDRYNRYVTEKREREKIEDARKLLDSNQKDLVYMLRHYRVRDPEIWIHQPQ